MGIWFDEASLDQAKKLLDEANVSYVRKEEKLRLTVDAEMIKSNASPFQKITGLVKQSWEG
jgi:hypothetical protein